MKRRRNSHSLGREEVSNHFPARNRFSSAIFSQLASSFQSPLWQSRLCSVLAPSLTVQNSIKTGGKTVCCIGQVHCSTKERLAGQRKWLESSWSGIRILSRRCRSWQTQRKNKILKKRFRGASA